MRLLGEVQHDSPGLIYLVEGTLCSGIALKRLSVFLCVHIEEIVLKGALRLLSPKGESD